MTRSPRLAALLLPLALLGPAVRADHLTLQVQEMVAGFLPACQAGNPDACGAIQYVQGLEMQMEQAYGACQAGDQNACGVARAAEAQLMGDYGRWQQAYYGGGGGAAPGYDPNNPLGATHADRMGAIADFGAQSTQDFVDRMNQMDIQHQQNLDAISQ